MRLLIFVLIVCGVGYYAYYSLHSDGPKNLIRDGINKVAGSTTKAMGGTMPETVPLPAMSDKPQPLGMVTTPDTKAPQSLQIVKFLHRDPPSIDTITIAAAAGCSLSLDSIARSIAVVGPLDGALIVKSYLESLDVVPGSCAVQSWAVFVDRSSSKGFDLVAALSGLADVSSVSAEVGGGGLTFDLSSDQIALALTAICDGSVVEVVQRPHIQLRHGVASRVESIQEVPVPESSSSQGIIQTSIVYRKVGLQLSITPSFLASDQLVLKVSQTNGLIGQTVKIGENEVPVIQSQTVDTSVQMGIGQTVILGGVSTLRERTSRGLLRNSKEVSEGTLYVIVSTFSDVPKAIPVSSPAASPPGQLPPLVPGMADPVEWIMGELLPPLLK